MKLGNCFSNDYVSSSGIPQGSKLGLSLFVSFTNDLPDSVKVSNSLVNTDAFKRIKINMLSKILINCKLIKVSK